MSEHMYVYSSPLKEYFNAFLDYKTSIQQDTFRYAHLFRQVDRFLVGRNYEKKYISKDIYTEWVNERMTQVSPVTVCYDSSMMRRFLSFTTMMGNECYIPMPRRQPERTYIPHVFSHAEMDALFKATDTLRLKNRNTHNCLHLMPALLRLLYSTGMRLGEALEIRNRDVSMRTHTILLRQTKSGHERIAPINETLEAVLREYLHNRSRIAENCIERPDGYFFCGAKGQKCGQYNVRSWFHQAMAEAGIPYYGKSKGPNVHCLRHTACVHALMKMVNAGKDPYCCLPVLVSFMGHRDVKDTEYYLHLSEELYPEILHLEHGISSGVNSIIHTAIKRYGHENG